MTNAGGTPLTGSAVTIRSENTPSIGYQVGTTRNVAFNENGVSVNHAVHEYDVTDAASHTASATARHWVVKKISTSGDHAWPYDCMLVNDVYDLQHIGFNDTTAGKRYLLKNDIDAAVTQTNLWNDGKGFKPIIGSGGKFVGGFDGAGHTIKNLYIHRPTEYNVGLFSALSMTPAYIEAHIANVTLTGGSVTGKVNVGSVVGYVEGGYLRNLRNFNTVTGESHVGGITGVLSKSYGNMARIDNAYNAGEIGTFGVTDEVGGIVGRVSNTIVQSAANVGEVRGKNDVGGVAGSFSGVAERLENIYNTGLVEGQDAVGGILGHLRRNGEILNGYHANDVHAASARGGLVGKAELSTGTSALLKNVIWKGSSGLHDAVGSQVGDGVVLAGADVHEVALGALKAALIYADWKDGAGKALVSTQGGKGTPWRLYAEETMPLLTGLMQGAKTVGKVYDGTAPTNGDDHIFFASTPQRAVGYYDVYGDQLGYDIVGRYVIRPKKLKVNFSFSKTYDGTTDAASLEKDVNYTLIGVVGSDDVYLQATGAYEDKNAGTGKAMTFTDLLFNGYEAENYTLGTGVTRLNATGTITKKPLTIEKVAGARFDKEYDGTRDTVETLREGRDYTLSGFVLAEGSGIEIAPTAGTYADKNAGIDKNVTFAGLSLTGKGAGNYSLGTTTLTGVKGTITKKELTLDPMEGGYFTKVYDGDTTVTAAMHRGINYELTGALAGDIVALDTATTQKAYATKDAQQGDERQDVHFTSVALTGVGSGNYTIAPTRTFRGVGVIEPKPLTVNDIGFAFDKIYDGTPNVQQALAKGVNYTLSGFVGSEGAGIELTSGSARYRDKNADTGIPVTFSDLGLQGAGAGNYKLSGTYFIGSGEIRRKDITIAPAGGIRFDKVYDGTANVEQTLAAGDYTLSGVVAGDELTVKTSGGTYTAGKNVGVDKAVTFGVALEGADRFNYNLPAGTFTGQGTISPKALRLEAIYPAMKCEKTYDGNDRTVETLQEYTNYRLQDKIGGDDVSLDEALAEGHYRTKNAQNWGEKQNVTFTNLTLRGADKANYTLADSWTVENVGYIGRRDVTVTPMGSKRYDKVYDGTVHLASGLPSLVKGEDYTLSGFVLGEGTDAQFEVSAAWYDDKDVGVDRNVTIQGGLTGTGMENYAVTVSMAGVGTISKRELGINFTTALIKKAYDGTTNAIAALRQGEHYTLTNVVTGEEETLTLTGTGTFSDKNVGTGKTVNYTGLTLSGIGAGNYSLPAATHTGTGEITPKELTLVKHGGPYFTKGYDGNTTVTEALARDANYKIEGVVAGEDATVVTLDEAAARGEYATKNAQAAGDGQDVTFSDLRLTGTGAGNYTIAARHTFSGGGKITPKTLTAALVGGAHFDKTYDGTIDTRGLENADYTLAGVIAGEEGTLALTGTGQYADKNAGVKAVTFTGLNLAGEGAGNYALTTATLTGTGTIAAKALTLKAVADKPFTKVYDGNTTVTEAMQRGVNYTLEGVVEGEDASVVTLNEPMASGVYATKDAQAADAKQSVTFSSLALTGTGAGNYTLATSHTFSGGGKITPRELTLALKSGVRFDKTYDGTANVTQALMKGTNYTLANFAPGEGAGIVLSSVTGTYADKNAGVNKAVNFGDLTLSGAGAANYKLNVTNLTGVGTIDPKEVTVAFTGTPLEKIYDGTTNAAAALKRDVNYTLTGFVPGEGTGITLTGTGAFVDKNVGPRAVTFSALTLAGEGAGNYKPSHTTFTGMGAITPRDLTLIANHQTIIQGEPLPVFTGWASGFATGEDESVFAPDSLTFTSGVTDTNTPGSYAVIGKIGAVTEGLLGNYRIVQAAGNATAFNVYVPPITGGILASLVQDMKPVFDDGYSKIVYVFGRPRPVRALTLGLYRFDAEDGLENEGLRL